MTATYAAPPWVQAPATAGRRWPRWAVRGALVLVSAWGWSALHPPLVTGTVTPRAGVATDEPGHLLAPPEGGTVAVDVRNRGLTPVTLTGVPPQEYARLRLVGFEVDGVLSPAVRLGSRGAATAVLRVALPHCVVHPPGPSYTAVGELALDVRHLGVASTVALPLDPAPGTRGRQELAVGCPGRTG